MGMIGRWIDGLTDEQRDGIIEHPDPTFGGAWWHNGECGCLAGAAVMGDARLRAKAEEVARSHSTRGMPRLMAWHMAVSELVEEVGEGEEVFQWLGREKRFTPQRMWRVVKARAAKANRVEVPEAVAETATVP